MYVIKKGSSYLTKIEWPGKTYHKIFSDDISKAIGFVNLSDASKIADDDENERVVKMSKWV